MNSTATGTENRSSDPELIISEEYDEDGPLDLCSRWLIALDPEGEPLPRRQTCKACGFPADTAYFVLTNHPPGFFECLRDEYRIHHGRMINYQKIARELGTLLPLCSRSCYASYVVESLRIPATPLQRFIRPFVVLADEVQELLH